MSDGTDPQPEPAPAPADAAPVEPTEPAPTDAAPEPEPAPAAAAPAPDANPDGVVVGSPDDARNRNWVPYEDRFKPVLDERNQYKAELDRERERNKSLMDIAARTPSQPAPSAQPPADFDADDPADVYRYAQETRQLLQQSEARGEAQRQTATIRADISRQVTELGFVDAARGAKDIETRIAQIVSQGGQVPDVHEVARQVRQQEIAFEKAAIDRYVARKTQPDARTAAPVPASPPVVEPPPKKKAGWGNAAKRIAARAAGRYSG